MTRNNENSGPWITRRDVLTQAALGAAALAMSPLAGRAQVMVAQDNQVRSRESFDFGWKFLQSDAPGAQMPNFADATWRDVDLPHDWSIEGPFGENEPSSGNGAYLPTGIGWCRKRFRLPASDRGRVVLLEFDGVYQNSEVWINGQYLGLRPYGFVPFAYELTPYLKFDAENVVAVKVDNSRQTNCRWYSGSGIYRHTWLLKTNALRVAYWGTFVTTPQVTKDSAVVEVRTRVVNGMKVKAQCILTTLIGGEGGKIAHGAPDASQTIEAGGEYEFVQQIAIDKPSLWSPSDPKLYMVYSQVREDYLTAAAREGYQAATALDAHTTPFGIREAIFDAKRGFLLNGERIKLNGACIHQEAGCVGSAVPEAMWERRLTLLREMGCNAIRTSHNPYAAEFLDLCDRMGFLVMNEAFDEWKSPKGQMKNGYHFYFDEWYERDLTNFIHRDRNHPSVVLWSAGNEVPDQNDPEGPDTLRKLLRVFHTEDPTRPVTVACDHIASEPTAVRPEFLAQLDVVGYNYVDRWRQRAQLYYSIDHDAFPQRPVIGTESSGMGGVRGEYRGLLPAPPPPPGAPQTPARPFFGAGGRGIDTEQLWKFVGAYDYVSGDFMWTGIDYLGEARWPAKAASSGVIDTCGFKKDGFYFYQSQWTAKPMLHLFPHWNWKGREGQFIPVTCYTNCDTVELFINGRSVGVRGYEFPRYGMQDRYGNIAPRDRALRTTADLHLSWDVPYEPGTLKAVGTKDGAAVVTMEVSTTGEPAAIRLSADRTEIMADRRDVAHIMVEVLDQQGRVVPMAENEITFDVQGEGKLIGVDNGNPQSHDSYKVNHCKAFNGLCLAVVQSAAKSGSIRIAASSPSLQSAALTVTTKA
ncbi:MAG: glycoside hydrolase family 2 TIM barrel-domain containing protein [Acidobacteriaceae bacterium]|jgi:beta-galactosidase